eukprot:jgi/Chrzof1/5520/Cz16g06050.t1
MVFPWSIFLTTATFHGAVVPKGMLCVGRLYIGLMDCCVADRYTMGVMQVALTEKTHNINCITCSTNRPAERFK